VPSAASRLSEAAAEARSCTACDLYRAATQTVFGEGPADAALFLVGEQPGDYEDKQGRPFVGPAGRVLDEALATAGIDRSRVYLTNAVKHFKFEQRGKRRIHQKPNTTQIVACYQWLQIEIDLVDPAALICLGTTAARAVLGRPVTIAGTRTQTLEVNGRPTFVTVHPSALLRLPDEAARHRAMMDFVKDLRRAAARSRA
jgi:DNA polymerase